MKLLTELLENFFNSMFADLPIQNQNKKVLYHHIFDIGSEKQGWFSLTLKKFHAGEDSYFVIQIGNGPYGGG